MPWLREPDRLHFERHGLPCVINRVEHSGSLCGYVGVPAEHPWHGKGYGDHVPVDSLPIAWDTREMDDKCSSMALFIQAVSDAEGSVSIGVGLRVHGGITYSAADLPGDALEDEDFPADTWWFGFDCAHFGDLMPKMGAALPLGGEYRTVQYVEEECEELARQLRCISLTDESTWGRTWAHRLLDRLIRRKKEAKK
jgi:hypothetical protein